MAKSIVLAADRPGGHTNIRAMELYNRLKDVADRQYLYSRRRLLRGMQRRIFFPWIVGRLAKQYDCLWCWGVRQIEYFRGPVIVDIDDPTFTAAEIKLLNQANVQLVVTTTRQLRRQLGRAGCQKPIAVIPSGWNPENLALSSPADQQAGKPAGRLVIGCCAPYLKPLDIKLLLDSLGIIKQRLSDFEIWLIGQAGPWLNDYLEQYSEIKLLGYKPHRQLLQFVSGFDIAVYPRTVDYGGRFSIKLIEYLGCGIPVVANSVAEAFLVQEAGGGLVVDKTGFAEAILKLAVDPQLRRRLGDKGRRYAADYSWEGIAQRYRREVFEKCL